MSLFAQTLLDYVSIIILVIVFLYSRTLITKDNKDNRLFTVIVISLMSLSLFDMLGTYSLSYAKDVPIFVNYFISSMYFVSEGMSIIFFYKYIEKYTHAKINKSVAYYVTVYFPLIFAIECLIANFFVFILFEFDKYGGGAYGPLFPLIYVILLYYYALVIILLVRNRRRVTKKQIQAVVYFILTSLVTMVVQLVFLPDYPLQIFGFAIATLILMLSLETPDYRKLNSTLKSLEAAREKADTLADLKGLFIANPKATAVLTDYNVKKYIEDIFYSFRRSAIEKRILFQMELSDEIPETVSGNRALLWKIVNNFLYNTISSTHRGSITLTVYPEKLSEEMINIVVSVTVSNINLTLSRFNLATDSLELLVEKNEDGYNVITVKLPHAVPKQ